DAYKHTAGNTTRQETHIATRRPRHTNGERHMGNIQAFAQPSPRTPAPPRGLLETTLADVQTYLSTARTTSTKTSFKRFVRFLSETGRMDYEQTEPLREFLQHAHD